MGASRSQKVTGFLVPDTNHSPRWVAASRSVPTTSGPTRTRRRSSAARSAPRSSPMRWGCSSRSLTSPRSTASEPATVALRRATCSDARSLWPNGGRITRHRLLSSFCPFLLSSFSPFLLFSFPPFLLFSFSPFLLCSFLAGPCRSCLSVTWFLV